jgi:hypothetical protein
MTDIVLVRKHREAISDADKEAARRVLFGAIDGLGERDQKSWRRLMNWFFNRAEPGEMVEIKTHRDRIGVVHRKHMALEQAVFESQERFQRFEDFRTWLKVGAGFVDWYPGPKGGVVPVPKSISYAQCEQEEFDRFHESAVAFLREDHAQKVLWPQLSPRLRTEMIETIFEGFKE